MLETELNRWGKKSILPVMISSATDAYQYAEARFGITKRCIQTLQQYQIPFYVFTKSTLILRDLDLFRNYSDNCFIVWSITTADEKIRRVLEPGTPPTTKIFDTIKRFVDSGIKCCVNIDPIIPFITDNEDHIQSIVDKCQQLGIKRVCGSILRLRRDIWIRIKQILQLFGLSWITKEYEIIYGFQEPFLDKYNLSANTTYTDNVVNNLKAEISKKNILYGFNELIQQITESRYTYVTSKQLKLSDFV